MLIKTQSYYYPRITATQIVSEPLTKLQSMFGGNIHLDSNPKRTSHGRKAIYCWSLSGNKAVKFALACLLPHLVVKLDEAKILEEYTTTILASTRNHVKGVRGSAPLTIEQKTYRQEMVDRLKQVRSNKGHPLE